MSKRQNNLSKTIRYRVLNKDLALLAGNTTELYRTTVSFCISVLKDNLQVLNLKTLQEQQRALERLIHVTKTNPMPRYSLSGLGQNIPAYFRRSAVNTALGITQSWFSNYKRWEKNKKGRPPVLRVENYQWPLYFVGMYKDFTGRQGMFKFFTGNAWVWRKALVSTTQNIPAGSKEQSIKLVTKGGLLYAK